MPMRGSCLCFGIPLDRAAVYVAISDVIVGASSFVLFAVHLKMIHDGTDDDFCCNIFNMFIKKSNHRGRHDKNLKIPAWVPVILLVCSVIQCLSGLILAKGCATKNRRICRFWLFITAITCVFTFILLRIYQMLVVSEYCHELVHSQRQFSLENNFRINTSSAHSNHSQIHPATLINTPPSTFLHPPPPYFHRHSVNVPIQATDYSANTTPFQYHGSNGPLFAPSTPPSQVPYKEEDDLPPSYQEAMATTPVKRF